MTGNHVLDWNEYKEAARKAVAEGNVLLKNENGVLPLKAGSCVSVFGRIQFHYYKSGTGSGGMVNVDKVTGILDALMECDEIKVNQELVKTYLKWEEDHPFDKGIGWGNEPWSQEEMPLTEELVKAAAQKSDTAIVIIGRTAGEDQDNQDNPGAFRLTSLEEDMMEKVRNNFSNMVVVLNVGNIIDMGFEDQFFPDAVLYAWQGGMVGGLGTVDILTGKENPSGKLTDTIAFSLTDYPSDSNFGSPEFNLYQEDIYVGYRYFETAAPDRVRYPFGFGLSYSHFSIRTEKISVYDSWQEAICSQQEMLPVIPLHNGVFPDLKCQMVVENTGKTAGKEVVQVYLNPPQGVLGKPVRNLVAFAKTKELEPGESQMLELRIPFSSFASYDETGKTGFRSAYVLEAGIYEIYTGSDVRSARKTGGFEIKDTVLVEQLSEALAPVKHFERMKPCILEKGQEAEENGFGKKISAGNVPEAAAITYRMVLEEVPVRTVSPREKRLHNLPKEIPFTVDKGYHLSDVRDGKASAGQFVSQFTDEDLSCIIRGEGMGSPKVTPGTAAAFGGVSNSLKTYGLPCACCSDGPSGMRFDSGSKAFSLPNGTLLASTFNTDLMTGLFSFMGMEMRANKVDVLLGPGVNIHRHPLNGRNFEYFSEDPFLTGKMAAAQLKGIRSAGVTATMKHFCANNQETKRREIDSVVSERALREIYLKGFEMLVKEAGADSVMTSYGAVNGIWTAGSYDLNTVILREEWGFKGIVMTDWWAHINNEGTKPSQKDFAGMIRAQNDLYMVCPDSSWNSSGDNTLSSLEDGTLTRAELRRCAGNICKFLIKTPAFLRLVGEAEEIQIINREEIVEEETEDVVYHEIDKHLTINLEDIDCKAGTSYVFALDVKNFGAYSVELTASSMLGELAQIPVTFVFQSVPMGVFTFNGTDGKWVAQSKKIRLSSRYEVFRLSFGQNGVHLKSISFHFEKEIGEIKDWSSYMMC